MGQSSVRDELRPQNMEGSGEVGKCADRRDSMKSLSWKVRKEWKAVALIL